MKKHHKKAMKEGSASEEAMESPAEESAEGGMKRGGKSKMKKMAKAEGGKAKMRLDKPKKYASGGSIDSDDAGVTPSRPFATGSPMRKSGGKC